MNNITLLKSYCENGWRIFPIREKDKLPAVNDWPNEATNDWRKIVRWYMQNKNSNWGIVTGDIIVIDIDPKNGGNLDSSFPRTLTVKTGSGGYHLYYENSTKRDIRNSASKLSQGIDIRGYGGYVVLPPSIHPNGNTYAWENDLPIVEFPLELLDKLNSKEEHFMEPEIIEEGKRNETLFKVASSIRARGLSEEAILEALLVENKNRCIPPLDDREVETIVESVSRYKQGEIKTNGRTLTDHGNAQRFVDRYGDIIRYCYDYGNWIIWDGKRWEIDRQEKINTLAYETAKGIYLEANEEKDTGLSKLLGDWGKSSLASWKIQNMIDMAKPMLPVFTRSLDKEVHLLNVRNGVINLKTGELLPHNPDYYLTKYIDVEYKSEIDCPKWQAFLDLVLPDKDTQKFVQKAIGYSLTGSVDEESLYFLFGIGANGKSTFIETLRRLLGEYAQKTDVEVLLDRDNKGNSANPYIARLFKVRMVIADEVPEGKRFNESLIKNLTGGDRLVARNLYKEPFEFDPTFKLWIIGNYKPPVQDMSLGFWRRMKLIPFSVIIPEETRKDKAIILREYEEEFSGILNWAIQGYTLYKEERLKPPVEVRKAIDEYKTEMDIFQQFIEDEIVFGNDFRILKDDLLENLTNYLRKAGEKRTVTKRWLGMELQKRNIKSGGHGNKYYVGLKLSVERRGIVVPEEEERAISLFNQTIEIS